MVGEIAGRRFEAGARPEFQGMKEVVGFVGAGSF